MVGNELEGEGGYIYIFLVGGSLAVDLWLDLSRNQRRGMNDSCDIKLIEFPETIPE